MADEDSRIPCGWPEALVVLFAFLYTFPCGLRVFDPTDSTAYFDGGYRVFSGQVPFRDFLTPTGPWLYGIEALIFKLAGVSYVSYVAVAALMNAAIAALALVCAKGLRLSRAAALTGALITAVWNLPIERGTPWYDPAAFLCLHAALAALLFGGGRVRRGAAFAAGAAVSLAFYGKQSTGAVGGLIFALYLLQIDPAALPALIVGGAVGFTAQTALWISMGGFAVVLRSLFTVPMTSGYLGDVLNASLAPLAGLLCAAVWKGARQEERPLAFFLAVLAAHSVSARLISVFYFAPLLLLAALEDRRDRAVLMALVALQYSSRILSEGETYTFWTFLGLIVALSSRAWRPGAPWEEKARRFGLDPNGLGRIGAWFVPLFVLAAGVRYGFLRRFDHRWQMFSLMGPTLFIGGGALGARILTARPRRRESLAAAGVCLAAAAAGAAQFAHTWRAKMTQHVTLEGMALRAVEVDGLRPLRATFEQAASLEGAAAYLRSLPLDARPFFVYPNYLVLYGILGQPSPQPFVWFNPRIAFRKGEPDEPRLCGALERRGVNTILVTVDDQRLALANAPCLADLLASRFRPDGDFGTIHAYRRR
jgi:hypothetical protein